MTNEIRFKITSVYNSSYPTNCRIRKQTNVIPYIYIYNDSLYQPSSKCKCEI